jgi:hypothetical protein
MVVTRSDIVTRTAGPLQIAKATYASFEKSSFMGDTFVRDRNAFKKFGNSIVGDIAKLAVKEWLEAEGLVVKDWDDERTDNWRSQKKLYDLQVKNHNIEVRSSVSKDGTIRNTLRNEHIISPADVRTKEVNVQVFFDNRAGRKIWIFGWAKGSQLRKKKYLGVRRVGPRLADFYMMPFTDPQAFPPKKLITFLRS